MRTLLYLAIVLLLLSGDIHGPPKHPCETCDTTVRSNQRRVVCDTCSTWSHIKCVGIVRAASERLSDPDEIWICIKCSLPFTHDPVNERQHLLQLTSSDILLSSSDTSCPTIGINTNSSSVPDITITSTTYTSSTTTPSQTGLFDNEKLHKGMKIAHLNICGLECKLDDLKLAMDGIPIDVLTLSETHLTDSVTDQRLEISGYKLYRKDRIFNPIGYGGVATYVNLSLSSHRRETLETFNTECLWTEIKLPKTLPILIPSVYSTPPKTESSHDALERTFVLANETGNELIILVDMNLDLLPNKNKGLQLILQLRQL